MEAEIPNTEIFQTLTQTSFDKELIIFDSMILILPQIQFEAILSKDAGEVAFQSEADRSHKILGFCHKSFSLVAHMALILKFLDSQ